MDDPRHARRIGQGGGLSPAEGAVVTRFSEYQGRGASWRAASMLPVSRYLGSLFAHKSRRDRDRINAKVMKDPRLADMLDAKSLPFDAKRIIYGGFKVSVDA
jgi:hypothetical protein